MPSESAAAGCSPTDRMRRPHFVLYSTNHISTVSATASTAVTSRFRFLATAFWVVRLPKIFGSLLAIGLDMVAPSKNIRQKNRANPGPMRFSAMPEMVWSARQVTAATACSSASSPPASPAARKPSQGLPVK